MKLDRSRLSALTPETLRGARPSGPVGFSLSDAPERERPAMYREFFGRAVMGVDVEPLRDAPFEAEIALQALPGLHLLAGQVHGSRNRRSGALLGDGCDAFSLLVNLGGPYLVAQGDKELLLDDGEATLVSVADPCAFTHYPPGGVLGVRFPRDQLTSLVSGIEDLCLQPIRRDAPALRLLNDYVGVAWDDETIASDALQRLFVQHVHDLVAHAVGATSDGARIAQDRGLHAARLHAIKRDIGRHLDQPDLSVCELARRHGCTPRLVQRLFEAEGSTFTEYVLDQRLAHAHRVLSDPDRWDDKISDVAFDSGFGDVSYFNRVFRRRFGAAPSDVRAQARRDAFAGSRRDN